jgi:UDP-N-acetylmuramoyl-tripeptide--D-alanyl-D-alanine ligase
MKLPPAPVSIDTRTLKPGDTFVALKGPHFDGHAFLATALEKGARALVIQEDLPPALHKQVQAEVIRVPDTLRALQDAARAARAQSSARFVALTGSNGKTTTKQMLAAILSRAGSTLATAGNFNNHIGLPLTLLRLEKTHRYAAIELGTSMPGDMDLLAELTRPQVALITNVGQDHLEFFGSPEGVLRENQKLFDHLTPDGTVIVNLDDPLLAPLAQSLSARVVTYSVHRPATVRGSDIRPWPWPMRFTLSIGNESFPVQLPVIGAFQVTNAVAAAAAAYALGVDPQSIVAGLAEFQAAPMRMQVHRHSSGAMLVNDAYNANPSSMRESIASFVQSFPESPRWVVLGDMRELGAMACEEHVALGQWLSTQPLEQVFLYGRDTRFIEKGLRDASKGPRVERWKKKRYLLDALRKALLLKKPAILFKASRRLRLEQLVQELLKEESK